MTEGPSSDRRTELRVAFLAGVAVAAGVGLLALLGVFRDAGQGHLHVTFATSGGVPAGAPVKVAGVAVGRVQAVALDPERRDAQGRPLPVTLDLTLEDAVFRKLHGDARVGVATQGPLGEPFIDIEPGVGQAPVLQDNQTVRGQDPAGLTELMARMNGLVDSLSEVLGSGAELRGFLRDATSLTHTANEVLVQNRGTLADTLVDLRQSARDLRALLEDRELHHMVDDAAVVAANLRENVPPLTAQLRGVAQSADNLAGHFTPDDGAHLKDAVARAEAASAALDRIATRADKLLAEVDQGKGTVGGLLKDPQVYKDLRDLVSDLKKHPWKVLWK